MESPEVLPSGHKPFDDSIVTEIRYWAQLVQQFNKNLNWVCLKLYAFRGISVFPTILINTITLLSLSPALWFKETKVLINVLKKRTCVPWRLWFGSLVQFQYSTFQQPLCPEQHVEVKNELSLSKPGKSSFTWKEAHLGHAMCRIRIRFADRWMLIITQKEDARQLNVFPGLNLHDLIMFIEMNVLGEGELVKENVGSLCILIFYHCGLEQNGADHDAGNGIIFRPWLLLDNFELQDRISYRKAHAATDAWLVCIEMPINLGAEFAESLCLPGTGGCFLLAGKESLRHTWQDNIKHADVECPCYLFLFCRPQQSSVSIFPWSQKFMSILISERKEVSKMWNLKNIDTPSFTAVIGHWYLKKAVGKDIVHFDITLLGTGWCRGWNGMAFAYSASVHRNMIGDIKLRWSEKDSLDSSQEVNEVDYRESKVCSEEKTDFQ